WSGARLASAGICILGSAIEWVIVCTWRALTLPGASDPLPGDLQSPCNRWTGKFFQRALADPLRCRFRRRDKLSRKLNSSGIQPRATPANRAQRPAHALFDKISAVRGRVFD